MICKQCGEHFPSSLNGKSLHRRSYCLKCSPQGSKQGYKLRRKQNNKICPICDKEKPWNKNNVCSGCRALYRRWTQRQRALELLGSKCVECGTTDEDVLTFHHKDPNSKEYGLSYMWTTRSWSQIQKELVKCEIRCHNCHRKLHLQDNKARISKLMQYYEDRVVKRQTRKITRQAAPK